MNDEDDFKKNILSQLLDRNKKCNKFRDIVISHAVLYDNVALLKADNQSVTNQCTLLKQQNSDLQVKLEVATNSTNGGVKTEKYAAIEQKLYRTQEELTELHRMKGANAQQVINLNLALQEMENERKKWEQEANQRTKEIETITESLGKHEQTVQDFKQANQTLNDEYQALHMAYESIEEKLRQTQADNADLIERYIKSQEEYAEKNLQNKKDPNEEIISSEVPLKNANISPPAPQPIQKILNFFGGGPKKPPQIVPNIEPAMHHSVGRQSSLIMQLPKNRKVKWQAHQGEVTTVRYSPSGEILATGGSDRQVKIWNVNGDTCSEFCTLVGCNGGINNMDYDPTEQILVTCSSDYATRLWTLATQRQRLTLTGHGGKVLSVRYLSYSHKVVTGSQDRTVKLWDVKSGSCVKTYMPGSSCNDVVAADPSGECIATGHFDRKIRFYDTRSNVSQQMYEIETSGRITSLDMPQEKDMLLCCTKNHQLTLFDMRTRSMLKTFKHDNFKVSTDFSRCCCSPCGKYIAVGSTDYSVFCWNAETGDLESNLQGHQDPVISCSWNGELVTGDKHGYCVLWSEY